MHQRLLSMVYFFVRGSIEPYLSLLFCISYLFIILLNTRRLKDPLLLFFLLGSFFYLLASLFNPKGYNPFFIKHLITIGFFMSVAIASYYIFVPMLQVEDLEKKSIPWINLAVHFISSLSLSLSWHLPTTSLYHMQGYFCFYLLEYSPMEFTIP